jgi:hypothetical protein
VVQDDNDAPVASAEIRIYRQGAAGLVADLETDSSGQFSIAKLAPGDYRIEAAKSNHAGASLSISHPSSAFTVRLVRYAAISGRVAAADNQPLGSASVRLLTRSAEGVLKRFRNPAGDAAPDSSGRYRLYGIPPGDYVLAVSYGASTEAVGSTSSVPPLSAAGSGLLLYPDNANPRMFEIRGGEDLSGTDFIVAPGPLSIVKGRVEGASDQVRFWVALTPLERLAIAAAVAPAAADGTFELRGIPSGSYYLSASGPVRGYGTMGAVLSGEPLYARMQIQVSGQDIENATLVPEPGVSASVGLRVAESAAADCPAAATVSLESLEDWGASFDRQIRVSRAAPTVVGRLPRGRFSLVASQLGARCYQTNEVTLDVGSRGGEPVDIQLGRAGLVRGRVSRPAHGDITVVLSAAAKSGGQNSLQAAVPGSDGRFTFAALPPGRYRVGVRRNDGARDVRWLADGGVMIEIEVAGGSEVEVDLQAPEPK